MILSPNSYFRKPPKFFPPDKVVIFDAIRYSLDICDISYERLKKNLYELIYSKEDSKPSFPLIYSDVWSIIQHAAIFYKIVETHSNILDSDPVFEHYRTITLLRNTSQHIDERITEILSKSNFSVYGTLSWYCQEQEGSNEGIVATLHPGFVTNKTAFDNTISNPVSKIKDDLIARIEFTGIIKPDRKIEHYEERAIILDDVITKLQEIIKNFEYHFDVDTKGLDLTDTHSGDVIIQLLVRKG